LLIVATDRISAFDYILGSGIRDKGKVLTQISAFWFDRTQGIVPNHVVSTDPADYPTAAAGDWLLGRSMLVRRTDPLPIECVARGYLSGSAWKAYSATGEICGINLPGGLRESQQLPEPIFTPATKAPSGHDMTPDSSRFWPRDGYQAGRPQPSFDKQFVRDYLERIHWNKQPPVPSLPDDVVAKTREKYVEAFHRLTGRELQ
jgi:phosphoribosylaminoimidazole-succinocarboxamide synthase